jgi:hypothetical protein
MILAMMRWRRLFNGVNVGKRFEDNRKRVQCNRCELQQYQAELCRRCGKPLLKPLARVVITEVPIPIEVEGRGVPTGSLAELERKAIAHALAEANNIIEAASRLEMGKTMLYQEVAEIFGKEANALRRELARAREEAEALEAQYLRYVSAREGSGL